jgi:mRNA interferase YafQ
MRTIKYTNSFKRDYKREKSGKSRQHAEKLDRELTDVVALLAADAAPPRRYADHPLTGDWKDFRDCHIRPDLVLIYRKSR